MGMKDYFRKLVNLPPDEEYDDDYYQDEEPSFFDEDDKDISSSSTSTAAAAPKSKPKKETTSFFSSNKAKNTSSATVQSNAVQVVLVKPTQFEDAPSIADHLNDRKTVVLNLEAANRETSRRLIDFLSGTAYATRGSIKKVANSTYIITPANVDVLGELIDGDFDTSGMFLG